MKNIVIGQIMNNDAGNISYWKRYVLTSFNLALVVLIGGCSGLNSVFPFSYFSEEAPKPEPATIAWLKPSEMLIAINVSEGYTIKNRDAVLILTVGDKDKHETGPADSSRDKSDAMTETFKLIKMPPSELSRLGDAADTEKTAYFRFDTDDHERAQALVDKKRRADASGQSLPDGFGLAPVFCREPSAKGALVFSSSILFSNEPDQNNLPRIKVIANNRKLDNSKIKAC